VAGGIVGHDNFGVFPLRVKLLNVREAKHDQIMKNEEIQDIKKVMGLQHNKDVPPPYRASSLKSTSAPRATSPPAAPSSRTSLKTSTTFPSQAARSWRRFLDMRAKDDGSALEAQARPQRQIEEILSLSRWHRRRRAFPSRRHSPRSRDQD
jgi:hypothetical protein